MKMTAGRHLVITNMTGDRQVLIETREKQRTGLEVVARILRRRHRRVTETTTRGRLVETFMMGETGHNKGGRVNVRSKPTLQ